MGVWRGGKGVPRNEREILTVFERLIMGCLQ